MHCANMADTMSALEPSALVGGNPPTPDWEHLFYPELGNEYFRQPLASSARSHIADLTTAAWMADVAMLAYGRSGPELLSPAKFKSFFDRVGLKCEPIGGWSETAGETQVFFASNTEFEVLSFRGTERSDWTDSLVDLTVLPVRMSQDLPPPTTANKTMFHLGLRNPLLNPFDRKGIGVHAGFQLALNVVWPKVISELHEYRAANSDAPIFFTGHSLGAALATIAMARFNDKNVPLFTYGSPRIGNKAFYDTVWEQADLGIHRFVDLFYEHTASMMNIDENGNIVPDRAPQDPGELRAIAKLLSTAATAAEDYATKAPPPPELVDHSPSRYCYFTWRTSNAALS